GEEGHRESRGHQRVGGVPARRARRSGPDRAGLATPAGHPMSAVAVLLIAVGVADVCRRLTDRLRVAVAAVPVVVVGCAALAGLWHRGDVALLLIATAAGVLWQVLCARAERTGSHQPAALAVFGGA